MNLEGVKPEKANNLEMKWVYSFLQLFDFTEQICL